MKKALKYYFLIVCLIYASNAISQNPKIDSLIQLIKTEKPDTIKINHLNDLAWQLMYINPDTSIILSNQAAKLAKGKSWNKGLAKALGNLGLGFEIKSDYPKALNYQLKSLKLFEKLKMTNEIAARFFNIGNIYFRLADFPKALDYYYRALKIDEKTKDKYLIAGDLGSIGSVYRAQFDTKKALEYYFNALKIYEELNNKVQIARWSGNIATIYGAQGNYDTALIYFTKSLKINEEFNNKRSVAIDLANIGVLHIKTKKYALAEKYLCDALIVDKQIGAMNEEKKVEENLTRLYETTNRYKLSLEHYKNAVALKDSIFNEEKNKEITQKEMNYEFEKKEAASKAKQDQKNAIAKEKLAQKETERNYFIVGFILVLALALFIFRGLRQKNKANILIMQQKEEVELKNLIIEEKQKEILDSIHYAKRIQVALLPTNKFMENNLNRIK